MCVETYSTDKGEPTSNKHSKDNFAKDLKTENFYLDGIQQTRENKEDLLRHTKIRLLLIESKYPQTISQI